MNLLLVLSAILTALTGAMSGGRVADVQVRALYGAQARAQAASVAVAPLRAERQWLSLAGAWRADTVLPIAQNEPERLRVTPIWLAKPRE